MTIREDALKILREQAGEGFETSTYQQLSLRLVKQVIQPKLEALYARRAESGTFVSDRMTLEGQIRGLEDANKLAQDSARAKARTDLERL